MEAEGPGSTAVGAITVGEAITAVAAITVAITAVAATMARATTAADIVAGTTVAATGGIRATDGDGVPVGASGSALAGEATGRLIRTITATCRRGLFLIIPRLRTITRLRRGMALQSPIVLRHDMPQRQATPRQLRIT